jgi:alpha-mannosidase
MAINGLPAGKDADLPESMSFLSLSAPNVLVSTIKRAEDGRGLVLRVYDIEGKDAEATLGFFVTLGAAEKTNIIEEEGAPMRLGKDGLTVKVGHCAIETFRLFPDLARK